MLRQYGVLLNGFEMFADSLDLSTAVAPEVESRQPFAVAWRQRRNLPAQFNGALDKLVPPHAGLRRHRCHGSLYYLACRSLPLPSEVGYQVLVRLRIASTRRPLNDEVLARPGQRDRGYLRRIAVDDWIAVLDRQRFRSVAGQLACLQGEDRVEGGMLLAL